MNLYLIPLIAILSCLMAACGGTPPKANSDQPRVVRIGAHPVFGRLEKTNQGYRFVEVSFSPPSKTETWIELNSLSPNFSTAPESDCWIAGGIVSSTVKPCTSLDLKRFRVDKMSTAQTISKVVLTAVTYGTAGAARVTSIVFDSDAYKVAVAEAETALGINRVDILAAIDHIYDEWRSVNQAYTDAMQTIKPIPSITDRSGFFRESDDDFLRNVTLSRNTLTDPRSLESLRIDGTLTANVLEQHFERNLRSQWKRLTSTYSVACSSSAQDGFKIRITCPATVDRKNLESQTLPIKVEVLSKTFTNAVPRSFEAQDGNLRATAKNGVLILKNLTTSFITVDAASVYYQGKISTISGMAITLPPQSESRPVELLDFFRTLPSTARNDTIANDAALRTLQYGVAVKYSVQSRGQFTLFREQEMAELEVLRAQLLR